MKHQIPWFELNPHIQIESIGFVQNLRNMHPTRSGVPYWILVLLDKGQRTLTVNSEILRISSREFFLLPPNTVQMPLEKDEHTAIFVHFYAEGKEILSPDCVNASKLILPLYGRLPDDLDCFMHMRYIYEHSISPYADAFFISTQLHAILSAISFHCQKHPKPISKEALFVESCQHFIRENACTPLRSQDYEKFLGLSYHQINQKFKKAFGFTVKQYHSRLRMNQAAQLIQSGMPIPQVAEKCGYEDYYFFLSSFKKEYGIAPYSFRKLHGMHDRDSS